MQKIRVAGIVAEYNPFHKGHAYMIQQLREAGCETVVCVMSGAFVQRAEPALLPPQLRAKAAVAAGADLVLRLPLPWAVASAERFAEGGAGLLAALGCVDTLAFGAETDNVRHLESVADLLRWPELQAGLKARLDEGMSFAAARASAAGALDPAAEALLSTPNNILGIEYIKALNGPVREEIIRRWLVRYEGESEAARWLRDKREAEAQGNAGAIGFIPGNAEAPPLVFPKPMVIRRHAVAHDAEASRKGYASASLLRKTLREGYNAEALRPYVPAECMPLYSWTLQSGEVMDYGRWELAAMARLRGVTPEQLAHRAAAGEGLESRLAAAVREQTTLSAVYDAAKTKRFAHSRVRRLALEHILHLPAALPAIPPFGHVLAAGPRGLALMRRINKHALVPVSTSLARLRREGEDAARFIQLEAAAEDLYDLCLQKPRAGGGSFTQPAAIQSGGQQGSKG